MWKGLLDETNSGGVPSYLAAIKTVKADDPTLPAAAVLAQLAADTARGSSAVALQTAEEELLREAVVMAQVGPHENLVSLVGIVTIGEPTMLLVSFCEHGCLLDLLRNQSVSGFSSCRSSQSDNGRGGGGGGGSGNGSARRQSAASSSIGRGGSNTHLPATAKGRRKLLEELLTTTPSSPARPSTDGFAAVPKKPHAGGLPAVVQRSSKFSNSERRRALVEELIQQTELESMVQAQHAQHAQWGSARPPQTLTSSSFGASANSGGYGLPAFTCADRNRMLLETARGMAHLTSFFVHRDLAARNVLVDSAMTCRIGDFGLSRGLKRRSTVAPMSGKSSRKNSSAFSSDAGSRRSSSAGGGGGVGGLNTIDDDNEGNAYRQQVQMPSSWTQQGNISSKIPAQEEPTRQASSDDDVYYRSEGGIFPIRSTAPEASMTS